jgi:hypothetical protein
MASVGPPMYPVSPRHNHLQMPVSVLTPPPSRPHHHADVMPFLMCSGLMVVGHHLDCYSLLSVVFAVFHGHSGHGSLAQDILSLPSRSSSRCAQLQLGFFVASCLSGYHSPSFAISFSHRSECFSIALHCFRVSSPCLPGNLPWGSRTCVTKGVEGKSRSRYIRTNVLHPHSHLHLPPPSPLYLTPTYSRLFPSSPRLPILIHQVADCLFISPSGCNCCDISCAGLLHHILGGPPYPP